MLTRQLRILLGEARREVLRPHFVVPLRLMSISFRAHLEEWPWRGHWPPRAMVLLDLC